MADKPLDLRAVEAELVSIRAKAREFNVGHYTVNVLETRVTALLAHCRALRADADTVVREAPEAMNSTPTVPFLSAVKRLAAVLAQATDEEKA